jgi:hypothetical protein
VEDPGPEFDPWAIQPIVSHYIHYTIPDHTVGFETFKFFSHCKERREKVVIQSHGMLYYEKTKHHILPAASYCAFSCQNS